MVLLCTEDLMYQYDQSNSYANPPKFQEDDDRLKIEDDRFI